MTIKAFGKPQDVAIPREVVKLQWHSSKSFARRYITYYLIYIYTIPLICHNIVQETFPSSTAPLKIGRGLIGVTQNELFNEMNI